METERSAVCATVAMAIIILSVVGQTGAEHGRGSHDTFSCCSVVYGSCRTSCETISLVQLAAEYPIKESRLHDIRRFCPSMQIDFWICMNKTLHAISRGAQWSGRTCCALALSARCQNACAMAANRTDLAVGCRESDEQNLYGCLAQQHFGDECCGNARTSDCLQACRAIFRARLTPTKQQRQRVADVCDANNARVLACVKNVTHVTPSTNLQQYLPCCGRTPDLTCRAACHTTLTSTLFTSQEAIDALQEGGCGPPLPHNKLWQCFFAAGEKPTSAAAAAAHDADLSRINQIGMDSAKLHCCTRAISARCKRLCLLTFSNDWTENKDEFEMDCLAQIAEATMRHCIDEVDEPCELGCDGLSFCTNFNNRPAELFRTCHAPADLAAQSDVRLWRQQGYLSLPGGIDLPIKNITQCAPATWQAIACTLQIKPCTRTAHSNHICRDDCYDILSECTDWTRMQGGPTVAALCARLSPDDTATPCVSLKPFLEPSDWPPARADETVSAPCRGAPCNATQVCEVQRGSGGGSGSGSALLAPAYICRPGCALGEASPFVVPVGTYVRIPVSGPQKGCLKICMCTTALRIERCQPLPCITYDACSLAGRRIAHASWFYVECNICSCFAGEITCTKRQCHILPGVLSDKAFTSLPCNCAPHYVPVCGRNGKTYPSACVAKCTGLQDGDIEFGACDTRDACTTATCAANAACVEERRVCLSAMHKPCPQYLCVNITANCAHAEPMCDRTGHTHPSLCHLLRARASLDYRGRCFAGCSNVRSTSVCGFNGVTYRSECEAWSDFAMVDYAGECRHIGTLFADTTPPHCASVKCAPLPRTDCPPIYPPGACCPLCAAAIRIVYSRKQIDRALYALKMVNTESLVLRSVLHSLGAIVQVAQCQLFGYLTVETDLFVTVQSTVARPSALQWEACSREVDKIATLIGTQSHRVTSELGLSALTVANVVRPFTSATAAVRQVATMSKLILSLLATSIIFQLF